MTLDPAWSNATVRTILAETPLPRRRRVKRGIVVGGIAAALIAGSSVAYAQGVRPPWVSTSAQSMSGQPKLKMIQFVDLKLPDGSRFAAWHGSKGHAVCDATADNWDGGERSYTGGVACHTDASQVERDQLIRLQWAAEKMADPADDTNAPGHWYPVLYGFVTDRRVSEVRVTGVLKANGKRVDLTLDVDPTLRSFSTVLLGSSPNPWSRELMKSIDSGVSVEFLDKTGATISHSDVL
jgi:hypothetical protein